MTLKVGSTRYNASGSVPGRPGWGQTVEPAPVARSGQIVA